LLLTVGLPSTVLQLARYTDVLDYISLLIQVQRAFWITVAVYWPFK